MRLFFSARPSACLAGLRPLAAKLGDFGIAPQFFYDIIVKYQRLHQAQAGGAGCGMPSGGSVGTPFCNNMAAVRCQIVVIKCKKREGIRMTDIPVGGFPLFLLGARRECFRRRMGVCLLCGVRPDVLGRAGQVFRGQPAGGKGKREKKKMIGMWPGRGCGWRPAAFAVAGMWQGVPAAGDWFVRPVCGRRRDWRGKG